MIITLALRSLVAVVVLTAVLGFAYPAAMTGIAQLAFPNKADGSIVEVDGKAVGSRLAAQAFTRPDYFHPRPSATDYNAAGTSFSNLGPTSAELAKQVDERAQAILALESPYNPGLERGDIPVDAVTTSGSGIDPHITPAYARLQAPRIAAERGSDARARAGADRGRDRRPLARLLRRARRERPRAQPPSRPGDEMTRQAESLFTRELLLTAAAESFRKLDPRTLVRNPVMFVVEIGSVITTAIFIRDAIRGEGEPLWFTGTVAFWLWLTVLFGNLAEAIAEGRGKAQAKALRATRQTTVARLRLADGSLVETPAPELRRGDVVVVAAGELIPADGTIIEGIGSVDESAITGESAPVDA